jgi:uncharacterized protein (DUF305 family)
MKYILTLFMVLGALFVSPVVQACEEHEAAAKQSEASKAHDHSAHGADSMPLKKDAPVDHYAKVMDDMHKDMMIEPTGDVDVDFVRGMIPHHQGAVDMAKIVLEKGKDPEIRKLAQDVIDAQEREIKFMNDWLKKHGQE